MNRRSTLLTLACCAALAGIAQPGNIDLTFDPGPGPTSAVRNMAIQDDGRIIVVGGFTSFNGLPYAGIVRLTEDGSIDTSFDPGQGADAGLEEVKILPDGRILVAGGFTTFDGVPRNGIARLQSTGELDLTFDPGSVLGTVNNFVTAMAVQPDGRIVLGGAFNEFVGAAHNRILRLLPDGGLDTSFDPGEGANNPIYDIALLGNGQMILGGNFFTYDGQPCTMIVRVQPNGLLDGDWLLSSGPNALINAVRVQEDGRIVLGGEFTTFDGETRNRIARVLVNGGLDPTFQPTGGATQIVNALEIDPEGRILVGGDFPEFNLDPCSRIARLFQDGSLDEEFANGAYPGASDNVFCMAIQDDGRIVLGGSFLQYDNVFRGRVARINSTWTGMEDASVQAPLHLGPNPCQGLLSLWDLPMGARSIELLSSTGARVLSTDLFEGRSTATLDVSRLHAGLYHVQVITSNGQRFVSRVAVVR